MAMFSHLNVLHGAQNASAIMLAMGFSWVSDKWLALSYVPALYSSQKSIGSSISKAQ